MKEVHVLKGYQFKIFGVMHELVRSKFVKDIQWNLGMKDTLGPAILAFIERFSSLRRLKMY